MSGSEYVCKCWCYLVHPFPFLFSFLNSPSRSLLASVHGLMLLGCLILIFFGLNFWGVCDLIFSSFFSFGPLLMGEVKEREREREREGRARRRRGYGETSDVRRERRDVFLKIIS
jgi:hypothetical protein